VFKYKNEGTQEDFQHDMKKQSLKNSKMKNAQTVFINKQTKGTNTTKSFLTQVIHKNRKKTKTREK
jgi:hypothetical protein